MAASHLMEWSAAFTPSSWDIRGEKGDHLMELHTLGIDLGKTIFHLVGLNSRGEVIVRKKFSRTQLLRFMANRPVCLVGMEACGGSHFLGRALREQGHEVRLIPAQYVKPYVKTNKNDFIDAEAIAEAVGRPTMRFVPIKRVEPTHERNRSQSDHHSFVERGCVNLKLFRCCRRAAN